MRNLVYLFLGISLGVLGQSDIGYKQNVPENRRNLVTAEQYQQNYTFLKEADKLGLTESAISDIAASPCGPSLIYLVEQYLNNPEVPAALNAVVAGFQDPPQSYGFGNPWKAASSGHDLLLLMLANFGEWCLFLPEISGDQDNGLAYIQLFAWFYYQNMAGKDFVQGRNPLRPDKELVTGRKFTEDFSDQRGTFLSSRASTGEVAQWVNDPRIEISDYKKKKAEEYTSWNDFFSREITVDVENKTIPSRPATMPEKEYPKRDYIIVAPTDCIMNPLVQVLVDKTDGTNGPRSFLENPLQYDTVLDVKGIPISLDDLLDGVPEKYRKTFVGGTGMSCVLMPNTYHHFHAPVNGTIVHAEVLNQYGTFGYIDWPNWVPQDGNVGRPGTDFSQFQAFERGVIIIEVAYANAPGLKPEVLTGYVASIPVGLDTIGSVQIEEDIVPGKIVKRGYTRLGGFLYGGSLDILLFSKGLATGAVQTRMGNQIGVFNVGQTPEVKPKRAQTSPDTQQ